MAIGVVILSLRGRYYLSIAFALINSIQMIIGLIVILWSAYMCLIFSPKLLAEQWEVTYVFGVTALFGLHIFIHFLLSMIICHKCYKHAHKKSTRNLLFVWVLLGVILMVNLLVIVFVSAKVRKHIVQSMQHSLQRGIHNYLKDPNWKEAIDRLQIDMECCGLNSYKEWYDFMWLTKEHLNVESEVIKRLRTSSERLHLPVTPWSCCRPDFPMQCLHDPLQQIESEYLWIKEPKIILDSIYTNGCLSELRIPIQRAINTVSILFILIMILFIIEFIVTRYLFTSSTNAVILKNPSGLTPGWFFGRGDFGYKRGKSVHDLMGTRKLSELSIRSDQSEDEREFKRCNCSMRKSISCERCKESLEVLHENPIDQCVSITNHYQEASVIDQEENRQSIANRYKKSNSSIRQDGKSGLFKTSKIAPFPKSNRNLSKESWKPVIDSLKKSVATYKEVPSTTSCALKLNEVITARNLRKNHSGIIPIPPKMPDSQRSAYQPVRDEFEKELLLH